MIGADTAWIMTATALVLFMTLPGLALFYGGLVRARNVLSVFMHCYAIACLMSVLWLAVGYSIAFGDGNGIWGGLGKSFLNGVTTDSSVGHNPRNPVLRIPNDLRYYHACLDRRCLCGTCWLWLCDALLWRLDATMLRPCRALDLGRRFSG